MYDLAREISECEQCSVCVWICFSLGTPNVDEQGQVHNKKRFEEDYGPGDEEEEGGEKDDKAHRPKGMCLCVSLAPPSMG